MSTLHALPRRTPPRPIRLVALIACVGLLLPAACSSDDNAAPSSGGNGGSAALGGASGSGSSGAAGGSGGSSAAGSGGTGGSGECAALPPLGNSAFIAIDQGTVLSQIVIDDNAAPSASAAATELQVHLKLATGLNVPIVQPPGVGDASKARFIIGPGSITDSLSIPAADLEVEAYRVVTSGNHVVFLGADKPGNDKFKSPATLWAVQDFLDRQVGVKWLWPGPTGTFVPKTDTITVHQVDRISRPALTQRKFRVPDSHADILEDWLVRFQISRREVSKEGHAFTDWWARFSNDPTKKKLFAVAPDGTIKLKSKPEFSKFNLSNPAVRAQIVADWKADGKPLEFNVSPNDGQGFCSSDGSRSMDKANPGDAFPFSADDVWSPQSSTDLTRRYVRFWNQLMTDIRAELPAATRDQMQLNTIAYSAYRRPPPVAEPLLPGFSLKIVPSYVDYDLWNGWAKAGVDRIVLRPNWWNMGGDAPHIPLHEAGEYIRHAQANKMTGIDMDYLFGYWGTQGANYYLAGRLLMRPDLCVDQILDEYTSAFGGAAASIRDYLDYWEDFTKQTAIPFPVGGSEAQNPSGLYDTLQAQHGFLYHPLRGSWEVIPYLYTDAVFQSAETILSTARAEVEPNSPEATRVQYLIDSLAHFRLRRNLICRLFPSKHGSCEAAGSAACSAKSCGANDDQCLYEAAVDTWNCEKQRLNSIYGPLITSNAKPGRLESIPDPGE